MSNSELQLARDMGAATYLSAYIWLMSEQLEIEDVDNDSVNAMAMLMVEPLNFASEAAFCMLMDDRSGAQDAMRRLRTALNALSLSKP